MGFITPPKTPKKIPREFSGQSEFLPHPRGWTLGEPPKILLETQSFWVANFQKIPEWIIGTAPMRVKKLLPNPNHEYFRAKSLKIHTIRMQPHQVWSLQDIGNLKTLWRLLTLYSNSLSQWTLKKKFELYFPYWICNPKKFKRLYSHWLSEASFSDHNWTSTAAAACLVGFHIKWGPQWKKHI